MAYEKVRKNMIRFGIKIKFKGIEAPIVFETDEINQRKIEKILIEHNNIGFTTFDTVEHTTILMNTEKIVSVHMLFEGYLDEDKADEDGQDNFLKIVFENSKEPFCCYIEDPTDIVDLYEDVIIEIWQEKKGVDFSYIDDEDGERFIYDKNDVLYYEYSSDLLDEGQKQISEEIKEEESKIKKIKTKNKIDSKKK